MLKTANMATIPERVEIAKKAVNSIIDQVDIVRVYLNNFNKIPEFVENNPKIEYVFGKEDLNATGKHYWALNPDEYYFTIDDDLEYPPTYVEDHIKFLNKFDDKIIVSLHGNILPETPFYTLWKHPNYMRYGCLKRIDKSLQSHLGGQGVAVRNTNFVKIDIKKFKHHFMDDIEVAIQAQEQNIPIIVREHDGVKKYLNYNHPNVKTLFETYVNNDKYQVDRCNSLKWEFKDLPDYKSKKISVLMSSYNNSEYIEESIYSVLDQRLPPNYSLEIIVGIDGCEKTYEEIKKIKDSRLGIIKFEKNIGTYNVFNSIFPISSGEIFFRFDSDDILGEDFIFEGLNVMTLNDSVGCVGSKYILFNQDMTKTINYKHKNKIHQGQRFWRSNLWKNKIGGYQPWPCAADSEANIRAINGNLIKMTKLDNSFICYRKHENSLTHTITDRKKYIRHKNELQRECLDPEISYGRKSIPPIIPDIYIGNKEGLLFSNDSSTVIHEFSENCVKKVFETRKKAKEWWKENNIYDS